MTKGKKRTTLLAVLSCVFALVFSLGIMSACGNSETASDKTGGQWLYGTTAPAENLGNTGDYYLNTETLTAYVRTADGTWQQTALYSGKGAPDNGSGAVGDLYLDTTDGILYQKTNESLWSIVVKLQGQPGRDGVVWFSGKIDPKVGDTALKDAYAGDFYLNTTDFSVWQLNADKSAWNPLGSIQGHGTTWFEGNLDPADADLKDVYEGDFYYRTYIDEESRTSNYQIYRYENGVWTLLNTVEAESLAGLYDKDGNSYFTVGDDGTVTITGTGAETTDLAIPGSINGKGVVIAKDAFKNNKNLHSVTIEQGVSAIGEGAFSGCSGLTDITIPESVTSIGKDAFKGTSYYQNEDNWDDGVLYIDEHLIVADNTKFAGGAYKVHPDTTMIADYAFNGCKTLTSIEIPKTLKAIGKVAFQNCSALESANIPQGVKTIEKQVFYNCSALKGIDIPDSVTSIESMAFQGCTKLASATLGSGVKTIGSSAFHSCKALTSIVIPEGAKEIGSNAFNNCSNLAQIELPHGLTTIEQGAFSATKYYSDKSNWDTRYYYDLLYIGNYLITRDSADFHTDRPKDVSIREGTEGIADSALSNCSQFTSLSIPASVTMIGNGAFNECSNLTQITLASGNRAFKIQDNCLIGTESHFLYWVNPTSTTIEIPSGITTIGSSVFSKCKNLKSITIPKSVKKIEDSAFYGNSALTSLSFEAGSELTSIGYQAFYHCTGLESVEIPDSVTSIDGSAFNGCTSLKDLTIGRNVASIGSLAFSGCSELTTVNWNAESCKNFSSSTKIFSGCTKLTTVNFGAEVQAIPDYLFNGCSSITSVTFAKNSALKTVGASAFNGCSALGSVELPEGVTSIGASAFNGCSSLGSVELPEGVTSIGANAFNGCTSLGSVELPESLTTIGDSAFSGSGLTELTLGENIISIGNNTFENCASLSSVNWNAVECEMGMSNHIFQSCRGLKTIVFGENVKSIPKYLFFESGTEYLMPLETVTFNCTALETIGEGAFIYCRSLGPNIVIPDTVTSIGKYAFQGCYALTNVTIGKGVKTIGINAFNNCTALATVTWNATACETTGTSSDGIFGSNKALMTFNVGADVQSIPANVLKSVSTLKTITFDGTVEQFEALLEKGNFLTSFASITVTCNGDTYTFARGVRQP